jgi:uncharacterized protein DUF5678
MDNALLPLADGTPPAYMPINRPDEGRHQPKQTAMHILAQLIEPTPHRVSVEMVGLTTLDLLQSSKGPGNELALVERASGGMRASSVADHLLKAQIAIGSLTQLRDSARKDRQREQEKAWLSENRHKYSGQWIALLGDQLLAAGPSSKEVFSKVRDHIPTPLVIKVEDASAAFSGW